MRIRNLLIGDIQFQFKYGFYFVYTIFTVFYICILYAIPEVLRSRVAAILVYTDPAAMGLFFMGAIVLLEKSQRVINSIAVSPVKVSDYILSKILSLGFIGTLVGLLIAFAGGINNIPAVLIGTFLGSALFTCVGLMIASKINSLNQFMAATVPFEIVCFLPPLFYLFGYRNAWMLLHPGCVVIHLVSGENGISLWSVVYLSLWVIGLLFITHSVVKKMFQSVGGVKL